MSPCPPERRSPAFVRPALGSPSSEFLPLRLLLTRLATLPLAVHGLFVRACLQQQLGGDEQTRTVDPLLAKQVLSQLSYTPVVIALGYLFSCSYEPQKLNNDFNLGPNGFHRSDLGC